MDAEMIALAKAFSAGSGQGATVDDTLTQAGQAADAKAVGDRLSSLSEEIENLGTGAGLTEDLKIAFINYYTHVMPNFDDTNGMKYVNAILSALGASTRVVDISATGISLSAESLSFSSASSQELTAVLTPSDATDKIVWASSNEAVATVNNGVVIAVADGEATITATAGSVSASCAVTVEIVAASYAVTNELTNVTNSNSAASVQEGGSYTANLTADDDYVLDAVTVTMGGVDVTTTVYADGVISIESVTGDIVITASATVIPTDDGTDWEDGVAYDFSTKPCTDGCYLYKGELRAFTGYSVSDYFGCSGAATLTCKSSSSTIEYNAFYDASKTYISTFICTTAGATVEVPSNAAFIRVTYKNDIGPTHLTVTPHV